MVRGDVVAEARRLICMGNIDSVGTFMVFDWMSWNLSTCV